jgi:enoyl-CoA hydratase
MDNPFFPHLLVEARDGLRVVTLNRPENFNAVDMELHGALAGIWRHLAGDPTARAVILTGSGSAFSAGGDMAMLQRLRDDIAQRRIMIDEARQIVREMLAFPLPLVAAVNGPAVGLGCSLALLCDIVYISNSAYLADPHVAVGLTAGDGGAATWPLLTSNLRAKDY